MSTDESRWGAFAEAEGATPLDEDETKGLRHSWIATRAELNDAEAANIAKAMRSKAWAKRSTLELLDDLLLRRPHADMFGEVWSWAGKYRTSEKNIGVYPGEISIRVRDLVHDAAYWFQGQHMTADEAGAKFHRDLVAIHPFTNGNGRHARAAADLLMLSVGEQPFTWGGGADLADDSNIRSSYIAALRAADGGDYAPLLAFVRS
jgi:Fic-DOC domain mobile mystery protein B